MVDNTGGRGGSTCAVELAHCRGAALPWTCAGTWPPAGPWRAPQTIRPCPCPPLHMPHSHRIVVGSGGAVSRSAATALPGVRCGGRRCRRGKRRDVPSGTKGKEHELLHNTSRRIWRAPQTIRPCPCPTPAYAALSQDCRLERRRWEPLCCDCVSWKSVWRTALQEGQREECPIWYKREGS